MTSPAISVVMPAYNAAGTLDRAVASVQKQAFRDWELLCVDDGSMDDTHARLAAQGARDARIRILRTPVNAGPGAARNLALRAARGEFVAYLDCDDEFYPDYLAHVARLRHEGDVLLFRFDWEIDDDGRGTRIVTWDPAKYRECVFMTNPTAILAIAHRSVLLADAGEFDDRPWFQEDWDLWKRLARTGATFLYLPFKAGIYHCVTTSLTHSPRMTEKQRADWDKNRREHDTPFPTRLGKLKRHAVDRIVFASPYSVLDPSSGAAVATWDMLQLLATAGFQCQAFGSVRMDFGEEMPVEHVLAEQGLPCETKNVTIGPHRARMLFTRKGNVPVTLFRNQFSQRGPMPEETPAFAAAWEQFLHANRPDVVVTYGGDPLSRLVIDLAKRRDIPVVFGLHNLAYNDPRAFFGVDYVTVPSQFSKDWYWERVGVHCQVLPNVVDPARVVCRQRSSPLPQELAAGARSGEEGGDRRQAGLRAGSRQQGVGNAPAPSPPTPLPQELAAAVPIGQERVDRRQVLGGEGRNRRQYLTFVNPQPAKGLFVFARIAEQVARRRPEIPILVVDSRGRGKALEQTGVDLSWARNLFGMANTPDPRKFYAVTKALVMPSLVGESFGLVAAEAMANGIPVLASNRGALPEIVGDAGLVFDIPARYTPDTQDVPTAAEVEPWVEAIFRLWDDPPFYADWSRRGRQRAQRWSPEQLRPAYEEFFSNVRPQPGPPVTLRRVACF